MRTTEEIQLESLRLSTAISIMKRKLFSDAEMVLALNQANITYKTKPVQLCDIQKIKNMYRNKLLPKQRYIELIRSLPDWVK